MSTNSFWTCCWKVSVEHVGSGLGLFSLDFFLSYVFFFHFLSFLSFFLKLFFIYSFLQSHCVSEPEEVVEFVEEVIAGILSDQEVRTFEEVMVPVFDIFQGRIKDLELCQPLLYSYLDVLLYFSHNKDIAKVRRHTEMFPLVNLPFYGVC